MKSLRNPLFALAAAAALTLSMAAQQPASSTQQTQKTQSMQGMQGMTRLGNLQRGEVQTLPVDLTSEQLPGPRLRVQNGAVWVPAFTDFKLHDCTAGPMTPTGSLWT